MKGALVLYWNEKIHNIMCMVIKSCDVWEWCAVKPGGGVAEEGRGS